MTVRELICLAKIDTDFIWMDNEGSKSLTFWRGMMDREVLMIAPTGEHELLVQMDYRFGEAGI